MQKEAKARIKINKLLEESGWILLDDDNGKATVLFENNIKITKEKLNNFGEDFEKTKNGFIDYLLTDDLSNPVCVLEAKSEDKDPLVGKEQARDYANSIKVRYIILSNGNVHYLWDKELGNPTRILTFPDQLFFLEHRKIQSDTDRLAKDPIESDYIVLTKLPDYENHPEWTDETSRNNFIEKNQLRFLRPYQIKAIKALQNALGSGRNRFLFEMATGTGKTLTSAALIKLYLKTKNARRVLFLVDRLELENQAKKAFDQYLNPDYTTVVYKENRDDWRKADIMVTTIQSLSYSNKYLKIFRPNDFQLVISDEAHRSIYGQNRNIFEYFIAHKLGLTATPKDYLKNVDTGVIADQDPRQFEQRVMLDTYRIFGCESGEPTYRYSLLDGVKDGFLINPYVIDCRTEITTELLSNEGYAVKIESEEGNEEEVIYNQRHFERKFFSDKTNRQICQAFMKNALRDPLSNEIGKTICFCVSRKHATKITQILNEIAHELFPGKYKSDFAVQITSDVSEALQKTINFANNNLLGHTDILTGYKSSKARVCVTVGMMTTGYDCQDLLNLCLIRPIFSPSDFVQIKGRGTRKFNFKYTYRKNGENKTEEAPKDTFKLFDFFANCEYFEEKYPYDECLDLPKEKQAKPMEDGMPEYICKEKDGKYNSRRDDYITRFQEMLIDENGMRIDRELYAQKFEEKVKQFYEEASGFKEAWDSGNTSEVIQYVQENLFNRPEEFFNLERIRQSYDLDRKLSIREILDHILKGSSFKNKEQLAEDEFEKFQVGSELPSEKYYEAKEFFKMYLIDEGFRTAINQKQMGQLAGDPAKMEIIRTLGKDLLISIPAYISGNVPAAQFS